MRSLLRALTLILIAVTMTITSKLNTGVMVGQDVAEADDLAVFVDRVDTCAYLFMPSIVALRIPGAGSVTCHPEPAEARGEQLSHLADVRVFLGGSLGSFLCLLLCRAIAAGWARACGTAPKYGESLPPW
jgi:hypothetical protein